jgi:hypothetical protein
MPHPFSAFDIATMLGMQPRDIRLWDLLEFLPSSATPMRGFRPDGPYSASDVLRCAVLHEMTVFGIAPDAMRRALVVLASSPFAPMLFDPDRRLAQGALWALFADGALVMTDLTLDGVPAFHSLQAHDLIANATRVQALNLTRLKQSVLRRIREFSKP